MAECCCSLLFVCCPPLSTGEGQHCVMQQKLFIDGCHSAAASCCSSLIIIILVTVVVVNPHYFVVDTILAKAQTRHQFLLAVQLNISLLGVLQGAGLSCFSYYKLYSLLVRMSRLRAIHGLPFLTFFSFLVGVSQRAFLSCFPHSSHQLTLATLIVLQAYLQYSELQPCHCRSKKVELNYCCFLHGFYCKWQLLDLWQFCQVQFHESIYLHYR